MAKNRFWIFKWSCPFSQSLLQLLTFFSPYLISLHILRIQMYIFCDSWRMCIYDQVKLLHSTFFVKKQNCLLPYYIQYSYFLPDHSRLNTWDVIRWDCLGRKKYRCRLYKTNIYQANFCYKAKLFSWLEFKCIKCMYLQSCSQQMFVFQCF